jgi:hypothetical protein
MYAAGFRIPYFDISGKPTAFWRFRYLETTKKGFDQQTAKKDTRYVQPPKTINELYLPPITPWPRIAKDTRTPLLITEGELKAACACKLGLPTIGLGGVWCFKSDKRGLVLLDQFHQFEWHERTVYVVYDSDASSNPLVISAENALCMELVRMGALPHVVRLPEGPEDAKVGLDDYLVEHGKEALLDLLDATHPWRGVRELHQLNQEVCYVEDPGFVLRLDTRQILKPRDFYEHAFAPRKITLEIETEKGTKKEVVSAAKEWLSWEQRNTVKRLTYAPGQPQITSAGEFNTWPGWAIEPRKGDVRPWTALLDYLFTGDERGRVWFEQWCACPLQHPGVKMFSACVLWGRKHGTGKSLVGYSLFRIYGQNSKEIKDRDIHGNFNGWAHNKQFIMGDEITSGDKRGIADHMKGMITQERITINEKFAKAYDLPDCINYYFTSNHPDAFFLEDDDRRFFIHEVSSDPMPPEFYERYESWINSEEGAAALFHHLLDLDLTGFKAKGHALVTASKVDMIATGRSDLASWVAMLRDDPDTVLRMDKIALTHELWRAEELLEVYDTMGTKRVTANGLAREMRRAGIARVNDGQPVKTELGQFRLWAVRNPLKYEKLTTAQIGRMYDQERGNHEPRKKKY